MIKTIRRAALTAVAAAAVALAGTAASSIVGDGAHASASVVPYTVTATTQVSNRPDSGAHGNWALDTMARTAKASLVSEVALSYCGGTTGTGHCYHWSARITDKGIATTIPGASSPGNGSLNGGSAPVIGASVPASMTGWYAYDFYSSWKSANRKLMPASEDDQGNTPGGRSATGAWPEQFFGSGAQFYAGGAASSELGTTGWWQYTTAFGSDPACPDGASRWVDSSWPKSSPWGTAASAGNILAPDAAHC